MEQESARTLMRPLDPSDLSNAWIDNRFFVERPGFARIRGIWGSNRPFAFDPGPRRNPRTHDRG